MDIVRVKNKETFITKAVFVHGDRYDYSKVLYVSASKPVIIMCKIHGEFLQKPYVHTSNKAGCLKCNAGGRLTLTEMINRANTLHGDKYDYSQFEYTTWNNKGTIVCPKHGPFSMSPRWHIEKQLRCSKCTKEEPRRSIYTTPHEYFNTCRTIHGDRYDYSVSEFRGTKNPITIICKVHGPFSLKRAYAHTLNKSGCAKCAQFQTRLTTSSFVEQSIRLHGNCYDYSKAIYITSGIELTIICPHHGEFLITPTDHYRVGCWSCNRNRMQDLWLHYMKLPNDKLHRQVRLKIYDRFFVVDGYDSTKQTVYLFHGDYWHGNPNVYNSEDVNKRLNTTFGDLYERTLRYEQTLRQIGYIVISIWEQEWRVQQKHVQYANESLEPVMSHYII